MRGPGLALLVLLVAGCANPLAPAPVPERVVEGGTLQFAPAVVALASCGSSGPCYEPSVAPGAAGLLAGDGRASPLARQVTGSTFVQLSGPGGAALTSGGDALVQAAPDGSIWWSVLTAQSAHVARTTDAGLTWGPDVTTPIEAPPDRQWLLFGPDRIVLTYQGSAVRALVSTDGGRSWSGTVPVAPDATIHGRGAWCGDRFLVPLFRHGQLAVATSRDGTAWSVADVPGADGTFFPALACDGASAVLAWQDHHDRALLARSSDAGATWGAALAVSRAGQRVVASPWALLADGRAWVAYFAADKDAGPAELDLVRVTGNVADRGVAASGIASLTPDRPGNTDFAHADLTRDGHVVLAYADRALKLVQTA